MSSLTPPVLVLIVDDAAEDREFLERMLRRGSSRYSVAHAGTVKEGLELTGSRRPDCILLDYSMPDADGLDFLGTLARSRELRAIPVVMLSGRGDETVAAGAIRSGAADYLVKRAVTAELLRRTIERAVAAARLRAELEKSREALERSHRQLLLFAYELTHDLATPLQKIVMVAAALDEELGARASGPVRDKLAVLQRTVRTMDEIIQKVFDLARATHRPLALEEVDLAELVREVARDLSFKIEAAGARVIVEEIPGVEADKVEIRRLFQNLLDNALKFGHADRPLEIRVRGRASPARSPSEPDWVVVDVADNGRGMDAERARRLAASFESGDLQGGGLGLGLAICTRVVERHQGSIEARRHGAAEEGTTISVRLPRRRQPPEPGDPQLLG